MNPLRDIVERLGRRTIDQPSPFRAEADDVLESFRASRRELEAKVKRGDLTPKVAREQAHALAAGLGQTLKGRAGDFATTPRVFLDRLTEACDRRKQASAHASLESLQRETNQLLRSVLVEQQIQVRKSEFESRAFVRPVAGGQPAPTLDTLLAFHQTASLSGDDAGAEWTRRQLESFRPVVSNPDDHRRIDLATDQPGRVNPRLVETYVQALKNESYEELERFVGESIAAKDANACMAAFILAREASEGSRLRWVRMVLEGVNSFPDAALTTLRDLEAQARAADRNAAIVQADFVVSQAESEARLPGVEAPSSAEVARRVSMESKPAAQLGESYGLTLTRRGHLSGEDSLETTDPSAAG